MDSWVSVNAGGRCLVRALFSPLYPTPPLNPPPPLRHSKRIVTFANQSDFISFRHHVYEKPRGASSVTLKEVRCLAAAAARRQAAAAAVAVAEAAAATAVCGRLSDQITERWGLP